MPFAGTFNFRPSGTGDTPTGYYYDYFRCTGDGDTDEQRCNAGGYFLRAGSVSTTYMTADQACNNPLCPNDIETNEKLCCEFLPGTRLAGPLSRLGTRRQQCFIQQSRHRLSRHGEDGARADHRSANDNGCG